ncbi:unnamed protein product [Eruca vesicaria subsp. sativa]|uniref:Uncharacterized protein n=1 Tax=Eruca vesicaria subsp. sativa TaxID=29727 RepID=A0ABC8M7S6_ERUVS|nr:unnamed protein product [Eruca vesicaria subsp. sativa]
MDFQGRQPGFHYFITPNRPQCILGQKLEVLVIHNPSRPISPPTPSKNLVAGKTYKVGDSEVREVYNSDFYTSEVRRKNFMWEIFDFSSMPTKSTMSMKSTVI